MDVRFRPYTWVGSRTPPAKKRRNPFNTSWNKTLYKLEYELTKIRASEIIIEADFKEDEIRLDGWPRANANPGYTGVKISFNQPGVGRVEYPCDSCVYWHDNVHSIALGLEALRAVERYGITGRMQQYTGFRALDSGSNGSAFKGGKDSAALWIAGLIEDDVHYTRSEIANFLLRSPQGDETRSFLRRAAIKTHPDQRGSRAQWDLFEKAKELLAL